jgi:hypothetical protein
LKAALVVFLLVLTVCSRLRADTGMCGGQTITLPFTDVMGSIFFCSIAEIYFQGITFGTSPTTYSPANNVTRDQMAAFLSRTLDTGLKRRSERAALDQFWTTTPHYDVALGTTTLTAATRISSDGLHVWVTDNLNDSVYRVRASDGKLLDTWTGASGAYSALCAMGRVFVTGWNSSAHDLYMIDPASGPGVVTNVTTALGSAPRGIAFDGNKLWTSSDLSVSIVTPGPTLPWSVVTTAAPGHLNGGIIYDGANIWVTGFGLPGTLKKLDSSGGVLQIVTVGNSPEFPVFDGKNIWVPNESSNTVTVVRASTGEVLATLSGNGLSFPTYAAFDGERILIVNTGGDSVSLWKATDLTPIGTFSTGDHTGPVGACSDGQYFWITLALTNQLARF